jgi:FKBP-type peptidyl-prolyl cis-trans isomerase (trigger factor)
MEGDDARVENGDMVRIGIKRIDNVEPDKIEGLEFREYKMIVGQERAEYGFDDDVLGMKSGEQKETKIKLSEGLRGQKDWPARTARYIIRVEEI